MTNLAIDCKDSGVPNQPKTKNMVVRLGPDLREPLEREAEERGLSLSDVVREAVAEHVERRESGDDD